MFNTMKKLTLATTVSAISLVAIPAYAATTTEVSQIDVTASYDSAQDSNAAAMFPEITSDVQLAIAALVPLSDDAADPIVNVDIRKIALDGDTFIPDSAEFNEIEGVVSIETESGVGGQSFVVGISAATGEIALPDGWVTVAPSTDDFYTAMVGSFAKTVAERVETLNTAGGTINR